MWSIVTRIASYGLILWAVSTYIPQLGFSIVTGDGTSYGVALMVVAVVVWFMDRVVKQILKIVTIPLNIVTLGVAGFIVNVILLYIVQFVIPLIPGVDVAVTLGSLMQVALLSVVLSFVGSFIISLL